MKKIFRPRNLLILFGLGIVVGIVLSKKNSAPAPSYPDPWASPTPTDGGSDAGGADASSNGSSESSESESTTGA